MRSRKGAPLLLFNGDGSEYQAILVDEHPKHCTVEIQTQSTAQRESSLNITLLQGISRGDRMDISIQKSTELGVNRIIPVSCERSTLKLDKSRALKKHEHWKQIMVSACEQSGRCILPELQTVTDFAKAVTAVNSGHKFVLDPTSDRGFKNFGKIEDHACILAGPEGGLSAEEIKLACDNGFQAIRFGPRILRTETAGPACISALQTLWGDMG